MNNPTSGSSGIKRITFLAVGGRPCIITNLTEAIDFLQVDNDPGSGLTPATCYEIEVRYNNGDEIRGVFQSKDEAIRYLRRLVE